MSNRPCNKCELERIKRTQQGGALSKRDPQVSFPRGVKVTTRDGKFISWFASVPKVCAC